MRRTLLVPLLLGLQACPQAGPQVTIGALRHGVEPYLADHPLEPGAEIRVDRVTRTTGASVHVVQLAGSERPHRHEQHDLFVHVLRGRGILTLASERISMRAGDVVAIERGVAHWFASEPGTVAVALVTFVPPLDAPDSVPDDVDSGTPHR
jgi:quercetin dioxygenase-like cupin family protein